MFSSFVFDVRCAEKGITLSFTSILHSGNAMMDEEAKAWKIEQASFMQKSTKPIRVWGCHYHFLCCFHTTLLGQISKAFRVHQILIKHQKQKRKGLTFTSPASKKSKSSGSIGKLVLFGSF